jgi:solute carrier family 12 protein
VLGSPSFRPRFRVHWSFSFAGALGCVAVMFLINPAATVVAGVFVGGVYAWLQKREMTVAWGDVRRGIWMAVTRAGLLRLRGESDPRNWRPHLLVLSGAPTRRWHLIDFANSLSHNRAIVTVSTVLPLDSVSPERVSSMESKIRDYLGRRGIQSLVRVIAAPDAYTGARRLVDAYGMGALVPNTIVLGYSQEEAHRAEFCDLVGHFHRSHRNVVIVRDDEERGFGDRHRIDIWWGGIQRNGGLMLILGYLLKTSLGWKDADVRLKIVVPNERVAGAAGKNLEQVLARTRTGVTPEVLVAHGRTFWDTLHESSAGADLVFMGMAEPTDEGFREYYDDLLSRTEGLPSTVFVLAGEDVASSDVLLQRD